MGIKFAIGTSFIPINTSQDDTLSTISIPQDPYCHTTNGRTEVCENFRPYSLNAGYVDIPNLRTYLNVRGAYTWAQNVYNRFRNSNICNGQGMIFSPAALGNLLPKQETLPASYDEFLLYIKDTTKNCGVLSNDFRSKFEIVVTAKYRDANNPATKSCQGKTNIAANVEFSAPGFQIFEVKNALDEDVPPGGCTDRRDLATIGAQGLRTEWQNIRLNLRSTEPGVMLLCRKDGVFEPPDTLGQFHNCSEMPLLAGSVAMTPNDTTLAFNQPLQADMRLQNLIDRGGRENADSLHIYRIIAVDVFGNQSTVSNATFHVHSPTCLVPPDQYCSGAALANPPSWLNQGVNVTPWDNCLNGRCPAGTHTSCDGSLAGGTCIGSTYPDVCGNSVCAGARAVNCEDPANVSCGDPVPDLNGCGGSCGIGTRSCVTGGTTTGTTGPTLPPPWSWGPGMFEVNESGSGPTIRTYVHPAGAIPTGYTSYAVDINVIGMSDRAASRITVTATLAGVTTSVFNQSGGPYYPIDRWVPFFSGSITVNGTTPPSLSITVRVSETFSRTYFTIRGIP